MTSSVEASRSRSPNELTVEPTKSAEPTQMSNALWIVLLLVLCAGCLFGYDQGVISGALPGIERSFPLSLLMVQIVTSWVTLGALVGSLVGGELADSIGRKWTTVTAAILFTLGAATQYFAVIAPVLIIGRLVIGAGVGVAAVAAPLYAAELAPASLRGRFVSGYQLAITVGIFIAYLVDQQLSSEQWRLMLGAASVPGLVLLMVGIFAPESPRWLLKMGRRAEALKAIRSIEPSMEPTAHLGLIQGALSEEGLLLKAQSGPAAGLLSRQWRRPLMIAIWLAVFQQVTGINAIIYYANEIFAAAGFSTESSRAAVTLWAIGGVNVLATIIAIVFIDRIGRRILLLAGLTGMGTSLVVVGIAFRFIPSDQQIHSSGPLVAGMVTVAALIVFIISFAFSLGPVVWTVINEVFPAKVRGRGVALATAVNWGSAYLVSQFFLSLVASIGISWTFWMFACLCAVGWLWVFKAVPETKGKTLEQIQQMWAVKL